MRVILNIIQNPKEQVLIRQILLKMNFNIITAQPSYANYLKALQYDPLLVLMELPANPQKPLQFVKIIRTNSALEQIPFILFGPPLEQRVVDTIIQTGVDVYLPRPLDLKVLINKLQEIIRIRSSASKLSLEKNQLRPEETALILDKKVPVDKKLDIMQSHIGHLLAFPATVASVLKVSQSEKSGAHELAQVIRSDPTISTELLRAANSVHFARSGKRIFDIKDAVVRIGFIQTKNIAMSLSVFKIMSDKNYATGFNHVEYWFHCLGVALIAEQLAKNSRVVPPDQAFIVGLLHDIGVLLYNEYFNDLFLQVIDKTTSDGIQFINSQIEISGFNHNELVERLFASWNFPEELFSEVKNFCLPDFLNEASLKDHPLAVVVNVADVIAKSMQIGREADCCVYDIPKSILSALSLPHGLQKAFMEKIFDEVNVYNQILRIDKRVFPFSSNRVKEAEKVNILCYSLTNEPYNPVIEYLKLQGYNVAVFSNIEECLQETGKFHLVVLTDVQNQFLGDIDKLQAIQTIPFIESKEPQNSPKMLLFEGTKDLDRTTLSPATAISCYPVDLRNIDMVIACFLQNFPLTSPHNSYGSFRPVRTISLSGTPTHKQHLLIVHSKNQLRTKFREALIGFPNTETLEATDGMKAVNLARTSVEELSIVILDINIPILKALEVVKQIKMLPNHKRARYIITYEVAKKEELIPFIEIDIRAFCRDQCSVEDFAKLLEGIGLKK